MMPTEQVLFDHLAAVNKLQSDHAAKVEAAAAWNLDIIARQSYARWTHAEFERQFGFPSETTVFVPQQGQTK